MKKIILIISAFLLLSTHGATGSDDWPVPAEYASRSNPVTFNNQNVKAGRDIWDKNCKSCHGDPGKFNALALIPPPARCLF